MAVQQPPVQLKVESNALPLVDNQEIVGQENEAAVNEVQVAAAE